MVNGLTGIGLGSTSAVISSANARSVVEAPRSAQSASVAPTQGVDTGGAGRVTETFAQLQAKQDELTTASNTLRELDGALKDAGKLLDEMEQDLTKVVKMYPPYPKDNPERVSLLNNISGLRRQIDELTFPPPDEVQALAGVFGKPEAKPGMPADPASETAVDAVEAARERMWDIPALDPKAAEDKELKTALEKIQKAQTLLEEVQAGMWQDVVEFVAEADTAETEQAGAGVREQLGKLSDLGIGVSGSLLRQAVE